MQAVCFREIEDVASLEEKLGRALSKQERSRIGVSKLRLFLEELLQKRFLYIRFCFYVCLVIFFMLYGWALNNDPARYINNVPLIIPLLEKEYRSVTRKLSDINQELRYVLKLNTISVVLDLHSITVIYLPFITCFILFSHYTQHTWWSQTEGERKSLPWYVLDQGFFVIHSFLFSVSDPSLLGKFTVLVDIRSSTKGRGI